MKVKVEDAEERARTYLANTFQLDEDNIEAELANWQKNGLKLDKEAIFLLDYLEYTKGLYNKKLKQFPYSVLAELFKIKSV